MISVVTLKRRLFALLIIWVCLIRKWQDNPAYLNIRLRNHIIYIKYMLSGLKKIGSMLNNIRNNLQFMCKAANTTVRKWKEKKRLHLYFASSTQLWSGSSEDPIKAL